MWVDIKNFEGYYQINENGEVASVEREILCRNGKRYYKGKILKPSVSTNGYYYVILSKNGDAKTCYIHQLMGEAFLEKPYGYCEIDHINSNKLDNRIQNIRWVSSRKENMNNPATIKKILDSRKFSYKSGDNPNAAQLKCITTGETFGCIKDFAIKYNINYSTIRKYLQNGKREFNGLRVAIRQEMEEK